MNPNLGRYYCINDLWDAISEKRGRRWKDWMHLWKNTQLFSNGLFMWKSVVLLQWLFGMTYDSSKKSKASCYLSEIYHGSKGIMHQERFSPRVLLTRGLLIGLLTAVQHKDTKSQSMVSLNPCCSTVSPVQLPSAKLADMQFPRLDLHMKQEYILEFIYKSNLFSHRHIKKKKQPQLTTTFTA